MAGQTQERIVNANAKEDEDASVAQSVAAEGARTQPGEWSDADDSDASCADRPDDGADGWADNGEDIRA